MQLPSLLTSEIRLIHWESQKERSYKVTEYSLSSVKYHLIYSVDSIVLNQQTKGYEERSNPTKSLRNGRLS